MGATGTEALGTMRRLVRIILALAIFLGGYYLGRLPNSPDIFGWSAGMYNRVSNAASDISAKADQDDVSVSHAAVSYVVGSVRDAASRRN